MLLSSFLPFAALAVFCAAEDLSAWSKYVKTWNRVLKFKLVAIKTVYDESKVCPGDWISWYDFMDERSPGYSAYYHPIAKRTERPFSLCYLFKYSREISSFVEADAKCQEHGGFLASTHSQYESDLITGYVQNAGIKVFKSVMSVWIGVTRQNRSFQWEWTDGTMLNYFKTGSRANGKAFTEGDLMFADYFAGSLAHPDWRHYDCRMMVPPSIEALKPEGTWVFANCDKYRLGYVCKRDYYPDSPSEEVNLTPGQPLGTGKTTNLCQWIDSNECPSSNPIYKCISGAGSYQCECAPGLRPALYKPFPDSAKPGSTETYYKKALHRVVDIQRYWNLHGASVCVDVDECKYDKLHEPCGDDAECANIRGGYTCRCNDRLLGWDGQECADINECDIDPKICDHTECGPMSVPRCVNVLKGGYYCECYTVPGTWIYIMAIMLIILIIITIVIEAFYLGWKWLNKTIGSQMGPLSEQSTKRGIKAQREPEPKALESVKHDKPKKEKPQKPPKNTNIHVPTDSIDEGQGDAARDARRSSTLHGGQIIGGEGHPSVQSGAQAIGGEGRPSRQSDAQAIGGEGRPSRQSDAQAIGGEGRPSMQSGAQSLGGDGRPSIKSYEQPVGGDKRPSGQSNQSGTSRGSHGSVNSQYTQPESNIIMQPITEDVIHPLGGGDAGSDVGQGQENSVQNIGDSEIDTEAPINDEDAFVEF